MRHTRRSDQRPPIPSDAAFVYDLLQAGSWLAKAELIRSQPTLAVQVRAILQREANDAHQRGDQDDAEIYAAHVSLIDEIEQRGVAFVQAEILRVMACCK